MKLTKVNIGSETLSIVCGAPNVREGLKVVVATVGTILNAEDGETFKIKKSKIRGEESFGMICGEDEIGLGKDSSGIMELDSNASIGTQAADYFDLKKGFKNKGKLPDSQLELFNRIDGKNIIFKTLRNGFKISGFKPNDLYLFFNSDKVTQKTLENRCSNDELEDILSKISSLI